jgi:hypothetical protein
MITTQTSISLAKSLRLDWHCRHRQRKPREGTPPRAKPLSASGRARTDSGLEIETHVLSASGRGRSFFLTSLFIEPIDCISVAQNGMQRNFEPMRKQVEAWQRRELTDVTAKVIIYEAFVEGKLEAPKHLARTVHDLYFRTEVRGVQTANNLEPLQRVHFRIQGTGSPSHSSRPRPNWVNSWKPASHARSTSWGGVGRPPMHDTPASTCAAP